LIFLDVDVVRGPNESKGFPGILENSHLFFESKNITQHEPDFNTF
jgi:hypothetical protein